MHIEPTPFLRELRATFLRSDKDIRFVGGCVRDALCGIPAKDIDLCTNATPDEQIAIYRDNRYRWIETGLQHGTVTVIDPETNEGYEITSLRVDTDCDGRHATVLYTADWIADLARRDLTINAMAMDFDGLIYDPFGGQYDLEHKAVRFVGEAAERITEDYLRILRYFRFLGRFGDPQAPDEATLKIIQHHAGGLTTISGERIWSETKRILTGPSWFEVFDLMIRCDVCAMLGIHGRPISIETDNPITKLVACQQEQALKLAAAWKMSNDERRLIEFLLRSRLSYVPSGEFDYRYAAVNGSPLTWLHELAALRGESAAILDGWDIPVFPVNGDDLIAIGMKPGRSLGEALASMHRHWAATGYDLDRDALIAAYHEAFLTLT